MLVDNKYPTLNTKLDVNGLFTYYDPDRAIWNSPDRIALDFGLNHKRITGTRWMNLPSGMPSNNNGFPIIRNAVIISAIARTANPSYCTLYVHKNGNSSSLFSITIAGSNYSSNAALNIELSSGDFLQARLESDSGSINYPVLCIELSWKI